MSKKTNVAVLGLMGNSVFMSVPHFHSAGETVSAESIYTEPGGKGCNQAVAAARLGAEVSFISCMGEDATAKECIAFMDKEGIACFTEYTALASSPLACILTDSGGENRVTVYRGSADHLTESFVRSCEDAISKADILLLNNECPLSANTAALELAEKHGVKAILNPAPYMPLPQSYLRRFYLITPNLHEARMLAGTNANASPQTAVERLRELGVRRGAITLGGDGAIAWDGDELYSCEAELVIAKDTTGAGDCFSGALAVSLAANADIRAAVRFAVRCAGLSVTRSHVMTALPYLKEL